MQIAWTTEAIILEPSRANRTNINKWKKKHPARYTIQRETHNSSDLNSLIGHETTSFAALFVIWLSIDWWEKIIRDWVRPTRHVYLFFLFIFATIAKYMKELPNWLNVDISFILDPLAYEHNRTSRWLYYSYAPSFVFNICLCVHSNWICASTHFVCIEFP